MGAVGILCTDNAAKASVTGARTLMSDFMMVPLAGGLGRRVRLVDGFKCEAMGVFMVINRHIHRIHQCVFVNTGNEFLACIQLYDPDSI